MIGPQKLSDIKREVRKAMQADPTVKAWLNRKLKESASRNRAVSAVEEDLLWVQQLLEGATTSPVSRRRAGTATTKKTRKRTAVSP